MNELEPVAIAWMTIAMKFEEKGNSIYLIEVDFIRLSDIITHLNTNLCSSKVTQIEYEILSILNWDLYYNNVYTYWDHFRYNYIHIFPNKMDLCRFDEECLKLIKLWTKHIEIYDFNSDIVALSITWIIILTNYNDSNDADFLNTAEEWLQK